MDARAMNASVVDRLLAADPAPIPEGGCGLRVLEVSGRRTGRPQRTPIGVLRLDDRLHLVCPDRERDWPTNLSATGGCTLLGGSEQVRYDAAELHGSAASRVVATYLAVVQAPWAVAAFGLPDHPTAAQVEPELGRMAVFALAPVLR